MYSQLEINLLCDAIYKRYGYDFRDYSNTSFKRRICEIVSKNSLSHISELIPLVIYNPNIFLEILPDICVSVTEFFRDPYYYKSFSINVLQNLYSYPYLKIWHAGCATGEEPYSSAILLHELGLLHKTNIYATDINPKSLLMAQEGFYSLDEIQKGVENYKLLDCGANISKYYKTNHKNIQFKKYLTDRIIFNTHNLVTDAVFGDMNAVVCRNVLIYFNEKLKNIILKKLVNSLCFRGYLCLGDSESIKFTEVEPYLSVVDEKAKIFQKIIDYEIELERA